MDEERDPDQAAHPDVRRIPWWLILLAALMNLLMGCVSFEQDGKAHVRYANCEGQTRSGYEGRAVTVTCQWKHSGLGS